MRWVFNITYFNTNCFFWSSKQIHICVRKHSTSLMDMQKWVYYITLICNHPHVFCARSPHMKQTTLCLVLLAWCKMALGWHLWRSPTLFCMRVGFLPVIMDSEVDIKPEDASLVRGLRSLDECSYNLKNGVVKMWAMWGTEIKGQKTKKRWPTHFGREKPAGLLLVSCLWCSWVIWAVS